MTFAHHLDAQSQWRATLGRRVVEWSRYLAEHGLADEGSQTLLSALGQRLASDKLVVAFVAEFSRGKSELINAIFFADTGQRVLPASPGRTTMCPVEMGFEPGEPPSLALLPIETRLEGLSLAELRVQAEAWSRVLLDVNDAVQLSRSLQEVTRTRHVSIEQAQALGFWDDSYPDDNPPQAADGTVEIPAWRHALINYPHPLLKQGLVVLDTPGLNALGAEPELTLGLLPAAHATVFILAADTGVTKSDMAIWREHLGPRHLSRFVVLNKIDTLQDPLASRATVATQIELQRAATARLLDVPLARVFPISARQALAARIDGDAGSLAASRLADLEYALATQLLPQRREVLHDAVFDTVRHVEAQVARHLGDLRRQLAEQTLELRGLRGKSGSKLRLLLERVQQETADFEQCTTKLQALRSVQSRLLTELIAGLASDTVRAEVNRMQADMQASLMKLGARKAFDALCTRLQQRLSVAQAGCAELLALQSGSFARLNAEFGFGLAMSNAPDLTPNAEELAQVQQRYLQYLGLARSLQLTQAKPMAQFRRMLVSRLRVVFERASADIERWNQGATGQVEAQLRERRSDFRKRCEALRRIQGASGELEKRLGEIELQDRQLRQYVSRVAETAVGLRELARPVDPSTGHDARSQSFADTELRAQA